MIDAHQHFWDPARGDYGWLRPGMALYRPYRPADLAPLLEAAGMHGSLVVQAAPTSAETDYLLSLAHATPWIMGVVGWIDLEAPDAALQIAARARDPLFVGLRPMLQDLADRAWILNPRLAAALAATQEARLVFDALIRADQLPVLSRLAERYPELSIVLDHAGKPPFADHSALAAWENGIRSLAARTGVACKLSGLFTELPHPDSAAPAERCIDLLVDVFGPTRLLWGSDWPVATEAIGYSDWLRCCLDRVRRAAPAAVGAIFGGNARRIYRLARHHSFQSAKESPWDA